MANGGDLKDHAVNGHHDFYELLGVASTASDSEIRRAYRKTALKYHPDKVGADQAKLDTFHILQIANDVLLDPAVRQLYDNARRAREEKKEREAAYGDRRKQLIEELELREKAGAVGIKRARDETDEEEAFQRELKRLAADGARRRKEREEMLRREYEEQMALERSDADQAPDQNSAATVPQVVEEMDRTIKLRYPADAIPNQSELNSRLGRFGKIQDIVTKDKKFKPEGQKHRKDYKMAMVVFESIVGAHAAITDIPDLAKKNDSWAIFEGLGWAGGKEPDCVPKPKVPQAGSKNEVSSESGAKSAHSTKVPSFGSFKSASKVSGGVTFEELTMMRLKNAERKRLAEKLRKEEEAEEAANAGG